MMTEKDKQVLLAVRRRTDEYTIKRKRRDISEQQKGLEDYDG